MRNVATSTTTASITTVGMKGDDMDDHEAARMLTLKQAVTDAAANRLSKAEVAEAIFASRIDRRRFDSLVAAERDRQAAARQQQDDELEQRRRHSASNRPLTPLYAERNDR